MGRIHQAIRRAEQEAKQRPRKNEAQAQNQNWFTSMISSRPSVDIPRPRLVQELLIPASDVDSSESLDLRPSSLVVAVSAPKSFAGQQYGILRKKLCQIKKEKGLSTVLVTSLSPSEGKTLSAVNLSFTIAQEINQRVLLVDANLERPGVESLLGFSADNGLADYLSGSKSSEEIILKTKVSNLCIASSGRVTEDPGGLLNCQRMARFLDYGKEHFDWVILDAPSLFPLAEMSLLSSSADGILLVVRHSHTSLDLLLERSRALNGKKLLGCVFNGVPVQKKGSRQVRTS
jgi:capsular exopolysaccharide synthesis family protein